jgi:HlyD family secretion protein
MIGGVIFIGGTTYAIIGRSNNPSVISSGDTVLITRQNINLEIQASGTVEPIQNVNISPKNPGIIRQLGVDQGAIVKKGQLLAIMENRELFAQGAQAEAKLKEAQAQLQEANIKLQGDIQQLSAQLAQAQAQLEQTKRRIPQQIAQTQAQLKEANSRLKLAETQLKRNESLLKEGAITADRYDQLKNEYLVAQASIDQIIKKLNELETTKEPEIARLQATVSEINIAIDARKLSGKSEIERLQANITATQAGLEIAKIQYEDTYIRAPFDGIITQRFATDGAFVTPTTSASSTASATSSSIIAMARGLEIVAKIPEIDLNQIAIGQPVEIVADAYPDEVFQGVVKAIAPEAIIEQNVTSFEVKIQIITGKEKLLSKMNVDVNFIGKSLSNILVVPTVAIVTEEGKTGVMIPDENNKPKFTPITIGMSVDDKTQVLTGLSSGQQVFINLPPKTKE